MCFCFEANLQALWQANPLVCLCLLILHCYLFAPKYSSVIWQEAQLEKHSQKRHSDVPHCRFACTFTGTHPTRFDMSSYRACAETGCAQDFGHFSSLKRHAKKAHHIELLHASVASVKTTRVANGHAVKSVKRPVTHSKNINFSLFFARFRRWTARYFFVVNSTDLMSFLLTLVKHYFQRVIVAR